MTETEHKQVKRFLSQVRRGLRGLPPADVEDIAEEMRTHLFEEIGERGDARGVLADFGDASAVAAGIMDRRLRSEDGTPVPQASVGRRYSAWATDVVVGLGPLVLVPTLIAFPAIATGLFGYKDVAPIWLLLVGVVLERWVMTPAELELIPIGERAVIPGWQLLVLAVIVGWAVYYWLILRRRDSRSVGMWMTGLRGVRLDGDFRVVRTRDITPDPPPLEAGRNRWWILLVAIPAGCLCMLLAAYYISFGVGSFLQPWEVLSLPYESRLDAERERDLCAAFYARVQFGESAEARALCTDEAAGLVDVLLERAGSERFQNFAYGYSDTPGEHVIFEYANDTGGRLTKREIFLTVEKTETADAGTYTETYRITQVKIEDEVSAL